MIKKIAINLIILSLFGNIVTAQSNQVEIFDISKGKVEKRMPLNKKIQQDAENLLNGITGVYHKLEPIPKKGIMIKVPLQPTVQVENAWINELVDEVIIIIPQEEDPYLMIFNDENKSHLFTFKGKVGSLLLRLGE